MWNPVESNLYGVPAFFSGDTPLNALAAYVDAYTQAHAPAGNAQVTNPGNANPWTPGQPVPPGYKVVIVRGRQVLARIQTQAEQIFGVPSTGPFTPPIFDTTQTPQLPAPGAQQAPEVNQLPDLRDRYPGIPLPPRGGSPGIPAGAPGATQAAKDAAAAAAAGKCSPWDVSCIASKVLGSDQAKDIGKRATLVAFALVLVVVGVVALR